jgi:ABC-type glycerol-3-phosphate transport system substrate-binding protein
VDAYLEKWDQRYFIEPLYWESVRVGPRTYGVPADTHFLFLLYRKDLFRSLGLNPDAPPATWEDLIFHAKALTRRDQGLYGLGLVPKTWYFQDFVWQAGGDMVREEGGKSRASFAGAGAVKALQFWKDLRWKYDVLQPNPLMREADLQHLFALGKVAMIFGTADQIPTLINRYGLPADTFGIAPLPSGPAGSAAHLGGQVYVLNVSSPPDSRQAAWDFVQFEMSPANQLWKWQRMQELGMVIVPGSFSAAAKFQNLPGFQMVQDVQKTARVEPHVAGWPQVRQLLDDIPLQQILVEETADPTQLLLAWAAEADRRFDAAAREAASK